MKRIYKIVLLNNDNDKAHLEQLLNDGWDIERNNEIMSVLVLFKYDNPRENSEVKGTDD